VIVTRNPPITPGKNSSTFASNINVYSPETVAVTTCETLASTGLPALPRKPLNHTPLAPLLAAQVSA
jgi:hypothetical protein